MSSRKALKLVWGHAALLCDRMSGTSHRHLGTATVFNGKLPGPLEKKKKTTFPSNGMLFIPLFIYVFRRSWTHLTSWQSKINFWPQNSSTWKKIVDCLYFNFLTTQTQFFPEPSKPRDFCEASYDSVSFLNTKDMGITHTFFPIFK